MNNHNTRIINFFNRKLNLLNDLMEFNDSSSIVVSEIKKSLQQSLKLGIPDMLNHALTYAFFRKQEKLIDILIDLGADPEMNNGENIKKIIQKKDINRLNMIVMNKQIDLSLYTVMPKEIQEKRNFKELDIKIKVLDKQIANEKLESKQQKYQITQQQAQLNLLFKERRANNYIDPDLLFAIKSGNIKEVKKLYEEDYNIYAKNDFFFLTAVKSKKYEVIDFLLSKGAYVYANNNEAIEFAITEKDTKLNKIFANYGVKIIKKETVDELISERKEIYDSRNEMIKENERILFDNTILSYHINYLKNKENLITINNLDLIEIIKDLDQEAPERLHITLTTELNKITENLSKEKAIVHCFEYAINNNCENAVLVLLSLNPNNADLKDKLFFKALKEQNLQIIKLLWDDKKSTIDLSQYLTIIKEKELVEDDIENKKLYIFNLLEHRGKMDINLYLDKLELINNTIKEHNPINNFNNYIFDRQQEYLKINQGIISKIKTNEIFSPIPKQEMKFKSVAPHCINIKKELVNINNETLTRKEIQKRWDKVLALSFFDFNIRMDNVLNTFFEKNGLNDTLLENSGIIIYRMPIKEIKNQKYLTSRRFICAHLPKVAEILFETTKQQVEENPQVVIKITESKSKTLISDYSLSKHLIREENKELKNTYDKFLAISFGNQLINANKEALKRSNWKAIK